MASGILSNASQAWASDLEKVGSTPDLLDGINWDEYVEIPVSVPNSYLSLQKYPSPIEKDWPLQRTPNFRLVKDHIAGVRPFRRGGFRLETERLSSSQKFLIHNYGHGGAGITLSWAVAESAVEKLLQEPGYSRSRVAVLGAGVIGLTTAYVLIENGFEVTLYSNQFHPNITSSVAGGQFSPSLVEIPRSFTMSDLLLRSWQRFAELESKGAGVSYVPNFLIRSGQSFNQFPQGTLPGGRVFPLSRIPFQGRARSGSYAWTLLVEPPIYLKWLTQKILNMGASIRQQNFRYYRDIEALPESVVINCLGMGAKSLFQDSRLQGIKGQLVLLEPQNLGYLLSFAGGYIFSRSDSVVLGGTYESGIESPTTTASGYRQILQRTQGFFS